MAKTSFEVLSGNAETQPLAIILVEILFFLLGMFEVKNVEKSSREKIG